MYIFIRMGFFSKKPAALPPLTPEIEAKRRGNAQVARGQLIAKLKALGKQFKSMPQGIPRQDVGVEILRILIELDGPKYNKNYGFMFKNTTPSGLWQQETNQNIRSLGTQPLSPEQYSLSQILQKSPAVIDEIIEKRLGDYMNNNSSSGGKRYSRRRKSIKRKTYKKRK